MGLNEFSGEGMFHLCSTYQGNRRKRLVSQLLGSTVATDQVCRLPPGFPWTASASWWPKNDDSGLGSGKNPTVHRSESETWVAGNPGDLANAFQSSRVSKLHSGEHADYRSRAPMLFSIWIHVRTFFKEGKNQSLKDYFIYNKMSVKETWY